MADNLRKYLICLSILIFSIALVMNFYALGCIVSLEGMARFALGNILYVFSLVLLLKNQIITVKSFMNIIPVFLVLNILALLPAYYLNIFYLQIIYKFFN